MCVHVHVYVVVNVCKYPEMTKTCFAINKISKIEFYVKSLLLISYLYQVLSVQYSF